MYFCRSTVVSAAHPIFVGQSAVCLLCVFTRGSCQLFVYFTGSAVHDEPAMKVRPPVLQLFDYRRRHETRQLFATVRVANC